MHYSETLNVNGTCVYFQENCERCSEYLKYQLKGLK